MPISLVKSTGLERSRLFVACHLRPEVFALIRPALTVSEWMDRVRSKQEKKMQRLHGLHVLEFYNICLVYVPILPLEQNILLILSSSMGGSNPLND